MPSTSMRGSKTFRRSNFVVPTQCPHLTWCRAGSPGFSPVQPVQFLSCTTVESASTTHPCLLLELNKHPTNHSSCLYPRFLCLCMYDDLKAIHEEAWMPFSESLEYIVLSSRTLLPGLFRISVVRMCFFSSAVLRVSLCFQYWRYLLAMISTSIILLWMVICFAGQHLRRKISDFSRGP